MTATTQPIRQAAALRPATPTSPPHAATAAGPVATAAGLLRAVVGKAAAFVSTLGTSLRDLADAGQLGPDTEREIGRWSGGRI